VLGLSQCIQTLLVQKTCVLVVVPGRDRGYDWDVREWGLCTPLSFSIYAAKSRSERPFGDETVNDLAWRHKRSLSLNSWMRAIILLSCLIFVSSAALRAQSQSLMKLPDTSNLEQQMRGITMSSGQQQQNVLLTVVNELKARLDRQAVIKLHDRNRDTTLWQTTTQDSESIFQELNYGDYDIEVSALGYETTRIPLHVTAALEAIRVQVVLKKDPNAIDLKASDDVIPPNQRKEAKRALYDLNSGHWDDAEKRLQKIYKVAPSSGQINFLYGYLFLQRKDFEKAEGYLNKAATLDPRSLQALTTLGRLQLQRQHYEDARKTLEQAVADHPADWMAHNLLADAYLKQKQYDKARDQAEMAVNQGKDEASVAELSLGQALLNLGQDQQGIQALKVFLQKNPQSPVADQVKTIVADVEQQNSSKPQPTRAQASSDLVLSATHLALPPSAWGPPSIDSAKPAVAFGVNCPYEQVIEMSGERMVQLVDNVSKFAATEDLLHEQLDPLGNPTGKETRKFDYVASISESHPGFLEVDEYRNERYGVSDLPDNIVTKGFMALAMIFHPDMRGNFQMKCEGLTEWKGQATWLIRFHQRDDKPSRIQNYIVGSQVYPVKLKGRAWITADNFQIVRIETEQMNPVGQLSVQHQIAEYGPIHFQKGNIDLWLPKSVDLYLEINRHRYYRRHSFDHYMLFSVNSQDKQLTKNENQKSVNP